MTGAPELSGSCWNLRISPGSESPRAAGEMKTVARTAPAIAEHGTRDALFISNLLPCAWGRRTPHECRRPRSAHRKHMQVQASQRLIEQNGTSGVESEEKIKGKMKGQSKDVSATKPEPSNLPQMLPKAKKYRYFRTL